MKQRLTGIVCASVIALVSTPANAILVDIGGGLIYDNNQDLTWTQNAGMFAGSWDDAMAWAQNLEFGGFDDWRLPTTSQFDDPTCSGDIRFAGTYQFNYEHRAGCTGGEMELLTAEADPWSNPLFDNVNSTRYWTDTAYRDWMDPCIDPAYDVPCKTEDDNGIRTDFYWQWGFTGFSDPGGEYDKVAYKTTLRGGNPRFAWAVRSGGVSAVPLPAAMWLFASGLVGLIGIASRRKMA